MTDDDHPYALSGGGGIPDFPSTVCPYDEWSAALMDAIQSDAHTVELVPSGKADAQVEIDGVPMLEGVAYPPQQFTADGCAEYLSAEGLSKVQEIAETVADDGEKDSDDGLYDKYAVRKNGEPVESCFVLEPESDAAAREALIRYAEETDDETLADDLREWVTEICTRGETDA